MVDFIYDFNQCLVKLFLRMVLAIIEHCLLLKFVLEKRLRRVRRKIHSFLMVIVLQMIKFDLYTMKTLRYLSDLILTLRVQVLNVCQYAFLM